MPQLRDDGPVSGRDWDRAVEALTALGRPPDVRAEALEPQEFVELERLLS